MGATVTTRRADCNPPSSFSRRQIPFAAASSSLAELSTRIDVARPIFRKNTGAHVAVKRRMRPIAHPRGLHVRYYAKWHQWRITIRPTNSARSTQIVEPDQSDLCRPLAQKYFCSLLTQITCISLAIPAHTKGRFAIVTDVGSGCDGRGQRC